MPADARKARCGGDNKGRQASTRRPSAAQLRYLERGLGQPGGKLPLFDEQGQRIDPRTIRACLDAGWAEPWARNPIKPDWLVCRLTTAGRALLARRRGRGRRVRDSSSDKVKS